MKILLVYLPFCTPVSPPYSLTNLHAFLSHNSSHRVSVLDLNIKFHLLKFGEYQEFFQSDNWNEYETKAQEYHQLTKKVYSENNSRVVKGVLPEYFDELLEQINKEKPDIVAFSIVYSSQAFYAHALLKKLKCTTVIGGPCVNEKLIVLSDHHFRNEVEFLNFLKGEKKHSDLVIDFPLDYSIYNLGEYFMPHPVIPLKTSTTCFYKQCTFCAHYANVPYKEYPLATIEKTVTNSCAQYFFLIDDMIPVKRLLELSKMFKKHDVKWACQLRPTKEFTAKVLGELFQNGLVFVLWGFESGSQKVLDLIKKGTNIEDFQKVLINSHSFGIKNVLYTMFGFPGETQKDFVETINFLKENSSCVDLVSLSTFGLQKGTTVYNNPGDFGITSIDEKQRTVLGPKISYVLKEGLSQDDTKKLLKKYRKTIENVNKYPKTMNFFREHMFFY